MSSASLKVFIFFTMISGVAYPLFITGISQTLFNKKANGSLLTKNNIVIGSELIGQNFKTPHLFHSRPSAVDYNPLSSGASNLSQTSHDFNLKVEERKKEVESGTLLTTSGSGLDPHITVSDALLQVNRITSTQRLNPDDAEKFVNTTKSIILKMREKRTFGVLGEERVNVLKLNRELQLILIDSPLKE